MTDHVYKIIEMAGTSSTSIEDAIKNALTKASKTVRNMKSLRLTDILRIKSCPIGRLLLRLDLPKRIREMIKGAGARFLTPK